jgi:hypothetical protein
MYDAKKDENSKDKHVQYDCISDRGYYSMCDHNNMVNIKSSYVPVEVIINEFN